MILLFIGLIFGASASAGDLVCQFRAPDYNEYIAIPNKSEIWTFKKSVGDFDYEINLDKEFILSIEIKDKAKQISASTVATTGAAPFAKPRQLALNFAGKYVEVNCW